MSSKIALQEAGRPLLRSGSLLWRSEGLLWLGRSLTAQTVRLLACWLHRLADSLDVKPPAVSCLTAEERETNAAALSPSVTARLEDVAASTAASTPTTMAKKLRCDTLESTDSGIDLGQLIAGEELEEEEEEMDEETGLPIFSLEDVGYHCHPEDAWTVVYDRVYDVTEYLRRHPGGEEVMLEYVGYDATMAFRGVGHSQAAIRTMNKFLVGILPQHERLGFTAD